MALSCCPAGRGGLVTRNGDQPGRLRDSQELLLQPCMVSFIIYQKDGEEMGCFASSAHGKSMEIMENRV